MKTVQCIVCVAFLALLGCASAALPGVEPLRELAKGNFSGFTDAKQEVIKTKADWEKTWAKLSARGSDRDKLPQVDFTKEMVVLVAMGQKRTGGYSIEVTKVETFGDKLKIHIKRREPPPDAFTLQVITSPFHAVAARKNDLKPEFVETKADSK